MYLNKTHLLMFLEEKNETGEDMLSELNLLYVAIFSILFTDL
jgi:hypothetical protein